MTTDFMSGYVAGAATAITAAYLVTGTAWWSRTLERERSLRRHFKGRYRGWRPWAWQALAGVGLSVWVFIWAAEAWMWVAGWWGGR